MTTSAEIKAAIEKLPRREFWRLANWFTRRKDEIWDKEMEEDARPGGRLDRLMQEALEEHKAGLSIPMEHVCLRLRKLASARNRDGRKRP